jgi:predicted pyridoxine 5'-phosphate oxidase superfamily flavin-nucleotide-binding protein
MDRASNPSAPFHHGEEAVQERAGVREKIHATGQRFIRSAMPEQHRELFGKLPTFFVGSLDAQRRPWASVLAGRPGFVTTPDERSLHVAAHPLAGDPLADHLVPGAPLGLLGLEPHTRRRNRVNGTVEQIDATGFRVGVDQSFGNCPQYIQARVPQAWHDAVDRAERTAQRLDGALSLAAHALLRRADTVFIASASAHARGHAGAEGVDVSHRGGRPGFVRIGSDPRSGRTLLTLPDFRGNFMFNTLGNIAAHPWAGLLAIDYASGDVLQLTGRAQLVWDGPELQSFDGAQRLLRIEAHEGRWMPAALPLRWSAPEFAPQLAATGVWPDDGA